MEAETFDHKVAVLEREIEALKEVIRRLRQSALMDVDTYERALETSPRTAELRKEAKVQ